MTPNYLMFGREPCLPVDFCLGAGSELEEDVTLEEWAQEHQKYLAAAYDVVQRQLEGRRTQRDLNSSDKSVSPDLEQGDSLGLLPFAR